MISTLLESPRTAEDSEAAAVTDAACTDRSIGMQLSTRISSHPPEPTPAS
jgi:hypothetical protein